MSRPTLDDLLRRYNLTINMLKVEILEKFYDDIGGCFSDWRSVARACEVNIDDLDEDWRREKNKKVAFLSELKKTYSLNATYQLLVEKLYQGRLVDDARKVCEVFKERILLDRTTEAALTSIGIEPVRPVITSGASTVSVGDQPLSSHHLQLLKWKDSAGHTQILRLYELLGPDWRNVADLVGLNPSVVRTISMDKREVEDCIKAVIHQWIQDAPKLNLYQCTWNGMCKLLNNVNHATASQKLRDALDATMSTLLGNFSEQDPPLQRDPPLQTRAAVDPTPPPSSKPIAGKRKMNPTELHAWLLEQGMDGEDAKILQDKGVNETVFLKISEKVPKLYDVLKEGSQYLLEDLQDQLRNRD